MISDPTIIKASKNGPYIVTNCRTLKNLMDDKQFESDGTVALCRCGNSKNKPFCDGTHASIGFSGDRAPDRVRDQRENYIGKAVTIHDNRGICAHAARCTSTLTTVFKYGQEPWVDPNGDTAEKIIATVNQCPSGALSYSLDGVEHRDRDREPVILIVPNGPYAIKGGAELEDVEWGTGASQEHFDICRCGHSKNKPFCSGAHWDHHFDEHAPERKE